MSAFLTGHKKSVVIAKPTELKPPLDLVGSEAGGFSGIRGSWLVLPVYVKKTRSNNKLY